MCIRALGLDAYPFAANGIGRADNRMRFWRTLLGLVAVVFILVKTDFLFVFIKNTASEWKGDLQLDVWQYVYHDYSGVAFAVTIIVGVLLPFGYCLSYTTFGYGKLSVSPQAGDLNEPVTVSLDVKNTGHREGAEVAELYVSESHPSVPRPVKELKGFAKVNLQPAETKRVTLKLDRRAFSFYDVKKGDWTRDQARPSPSEALLPPLKDGKIQTATLDDLRHWLQLPRRFSSTGRCG